MGFGGEADGQDDLRSLPPWFSDGVLGGLVEFMLGSRRLHTNGMVWAWIEVLWGKCTIVVAHVSRKFRVTSVFVNNVRPLPSIRFCYGMSS